MPDSFK